MKSVLASALVLSGLMGVAPLAQAATFSETSDYSSVAGSPTVVGAGYDSVSGLLTGGDWDYLAFGLSDQKRAVTLDFALANLNSPNGAGFQLYYSYSPFTGGNNSFKQPNNQWVTQTVTPGSVNLENWAPGQRTATQYIINADPALGMTLYLALSGTFATGSGITYNIAGFADAPVAARPGLDQPATDIPAVPLPAGGLLLLSGLGAVALWRRRKAA